MRLLRKVSELSHNVRSRLALLATTLAFLSAQPSFAIDNRQTDTEMLPIGAVTSAPDGASNVCNVYVWACAQSGRTLKIGELKLRELRKVNTRINQSVRSVSDLQQYGIAERWTLPTKGKGDCEDYALYKKYELTRAGFPAEQLLIATLLDLNRASHAVLVVRTGANDLVLDNLTNKIVPWHKTGYTFLRMQDPRKPKRWVSVMAGGIFLR